MYKCVVGDLLISGAQNYFLIMFTGDVLCLFSSCHLNSPHAVAFTVSKARVTARCASNTCLSSHLLSAFPASPLSEVLGNFPSGGVHKGASLWEQKPKVAPGRDQKCGAFMASSGGRDPDCVSPCVEMVFGGVLLLVSALIIPS